MERLIGLNRCKHLFWIVIHEKSSSKNTLCFILFSFYRVHEGIYFRLRNQTFLRKKDLCKKCYNCPIPLGSFLILYKIVIEKWTLITWNFILTRQDFLDLNSRPVHLDHQAVYLHLARSKPQLLRRRHLFQLNKRQLHLLLIQEPSLYVCSATRSYGLEMALASGIFLFL
ncbi:Uncharacterised protein [Streptococcus pneumoniae]|nr:Uncharacterised protein [Streptococcus pneumoniae]